MISIVIPTRNEKYLEKTVQCLIRAGRGLAMEIIVVNDGGAPCFGIKAGTVKFDSFPNVEMVVRSFDSPVGVGPCRDDAIVNAKYETLFICDAHMDFEDGMFHKIVDYFSHEDHAEHVACCVCCGLDVEAEWNTMIEAPFGIKSNWGNTRRFAVNLKPKHLDDNHPWAKHRVFASSWVDNPKHVDFARRRDAVEMEVAVEVPSVLGANYAFYRPWYQSGLGSPWRNLCGWGSSEQTLSLVNWFAGGKNMLLPLHTAHWFKPKYEGHAVPPHWILYNQLRLVALLPIESEVKADLNEWIKSGMVEPSIYDMAMTMLQASPTADEAARLAEGWSPSFDDWAERWQVPTS